MCRLAVFPAFFPRQEAMRILYRMAPGNCDGFGYTYLRDGQFIINKWPKSLYSVHRKNPDILSHMPHNGLTVVHERAASHGANTYANTHPMKVGNYVMAHNGIYDNYKFVKTILKPFVRFQGQTDSEAAFNLLNIVGPKVFCKLVDFGGVYLALNIDGSLWISKTSGRLEISPWQDKVLIATDLSARKYPDAIPANDGWYHFDKYGKFLKKKTEESSYWGHFNGRGYSPKKIKSESFNNVRSFDPEDASNYYIGYVPTLPSYRKPKTDSDMPPYRHHIME